MVSDQYYSLSIEGIDEICYVRLNNSLENSILTPFMVDISLLMVTFVPIFLLTSDFLLLVILILLNGLYVKLLNYLYHSVVHLSTLHSMVLVSNVSWELN